MFFLIFATFSAFSFTVIENDKSSTPFQSPPPRMDLTQIIFDPSPKGSNMEGVSRTAPLKKSSASPFSYLSPAPASLVRLDRLSAFVGLRGSGNPFF